MKSVVLLGVVLLVGCASTSTIPSPPQTQVSLSWQAPTLLTNEQPLTDLTGYQVSWYAAGGVLQQKQLGPTTATSLILTPGSWQFYVQAISQSAGVGVKSQTVEKVIP